MKKVIGVLLATVFGVSLVCAEWESVDTWAMDSEGLYQISDNNTSLGGYYATNLQQVAQTPGDGLFIFSPTNTSGFSGKTLLSSPTDLTTDRVRFTWTYDSLDFSSNATANTKHGFRLWNAAETDWVGISIDDVGNSDKVFVFLKDGDGVFGNTTKAGRLVNGLGPDSTSRTFQMELDFANNEILVYSDDWQWIPTEQNGDPVFVFPYDFTANGFTDVSRFQLFYQNWSDGDYLVQDLMAVERQQVTEPVGVFLAERESYLSANVGETNVIASLSVTNGDWVVVQAAANKGTWDEDTLSISGAVSQVEFQVNNGSGPNTFLWYAPVLGEGIVDIELEVDAADAAFGAIGAYVVRSTTGVADVLAIAQAGSVTNTGPSVALSYTNVYDLGTTASGLFIESFSAYADGMSVDNADLVFDANQGNFKRVVGSAPFSEVSSITNIYSTVTTNRQAAVLGIAFTTEVSPQLKYDIWLADYPGVGADIGFADDPDGDLLDNLGEYAFDGIPDNSGNRGYYPVEQQVVDGGTNYLLYIHYERMDKTSRGLEYNLEVNTDLVNGSWVSTGIEFMGAGMGPAGFNAVTNRIPADTELEQFLRLQVEFTP